MAQLRAKHRSVRLEKWDANVGSLQCGCSPKEKHKDWTQNYRRKLCENACPKYKSTGPYAISKAPRCPKGLKCDRCHLCGRDAHALQVQESWEHYVQECREDPLEAMASPGRQIRGNSCSQQQPQQQKSGRTTAAAPAISSRRQSEQAPGATSEAAARAGGPARATAFDHGVEARQRRPEQTRATSTTGAAARGGKGISSKTRLVPRGGKFKGKREAARSSVDHDVGAAARCPWEPAAAPTPAGASPPAPAFTAFSGEDIAKFMSSR
ncbi:unnamed protein product [Amoebophrya sp. A120]|nr:unnamed protein product [Amoebophrya sp. A120]|eukprot:GSA120T00013481001.1